MKTLLLPLLLGLMASAQAVERPSEIVVASEAWERYSEADGTGLAWDLLRKVFEPAGVSLKIVSVPYTRAVGLVQRGGADAWLGAYAGEQPEALYPRWHYDVDSVQAIGLASLPPPSLDGLAKYRLAWMRGYSFEQYIPGTLHYRELRSRSGVIDMLERGHADFYLDDDDEVAGVLAQAKDSQRFQVVDILHLPLYLAFHDSARGRALRTLYDERMDELVRSGALREIFARWQQDYPYP